MVALPFIAVALSAAGAGVSYFGAQQQAKAQEMAGQYNARVNQMRADEELKTSAENALRQRSNNQRKIASMRSRMAGSGVAFDGSALDTIAESSRVLEIEAADAFSRGSARASSFESAAGMSLFEGYSSASGTRTAAAGNLLSDAGGIANQVYRLK